MQAASFSKPATLPKRAALPRARVVQRPVSDDAAMSTFYLVALLFASVTLVIAGGALTLIGSIGR